MATYTLKEVITLENYGDRVIMEMNNAPEDFIEAKKAMPDHIVLFKVGEFYETYWLDAQNVADICDVTLTWAKGGLLRMAGFPCTALNKYLILLIQHGEKVAIYEKA